MPGLVSSTFTWETVNSFNVGFDVSAFNNRLQVVFDWFKRKTTGMLSEGIEIPSVVGAGAPLQNIADLSSKGWEINRLSGNFWLVSFKISYLCLPLFYETRTTPSCHPSGCAYRQL